MYAKNCSFIPLQRINIQRHAMVFTNAKGPNFIYSLKDDKKRIMIM